MSNAGIAAVLALVIGYFVLGIGGVVTAIAGASSGSFPAVVLGGVMTIAAVWCLLKALTD